MLDDFCVADNEKAFPGLAGRCEDSKGQDSGSPTQLESGGWAELVGHRAEWLRQNFYHQASTTGWLHVLLAEYSINDSCWEFYDIRQRCHLLGLSYGDNP